MLSQLARIPVTRQGRRGFMYGLCRLTQNFIVNILVR